jgi:acetyl-CoA acetyltransferase
MIWHILLAAVLILPGLAWMVLAYGAAYMSDAPGKGGEEWWWGLIPIALGVWSFWWW